MSPAVGLSSAAGFASPNDEGVVKHFAFLEIVDERAAGLVDVLADFFEVAVEVLAGAAGAVPVGVVKLHEAGARFDEAAGKKAV